MAGLYSRVKTWVTKEILTAADLNAEFDNVINNFIPTKIDDYSANVTEMQTQTDPGSQGSESQPTTLAGEIERIRYALDGIKGKTYWYDTPDINLAQVNLNIDLPQNRIVSGRVSTTSEQPMHLQANGAAATISLLGDTTDFVYNIDGTQYTISSDITKTLLTTAPSSNNTCAVNGSQYTSVTSFQNGLNGKEIEIDTVGSEIVSLVGSRVAFKHGSTEYFTAYIESATILKDIRRSGFFDSTDSPELSIEINDGTTFTLLKLTWVFANTAGALEVVYNEPVISATQPTSPTTNDYWFDSVNDTWKKYNGSTYEAANAVLVGECVQDSTNCVASRSYYPSKTSYSHINNLVLDTIDESNDKVSGVQTEGSEISVYGIMYKYSGETIEWDFNADFESGQSFGNNDAYLYVTEDGTVKLSYQPPMDFNFQLKGWYHPCQSWRAVGLIDTAAGTTIYQETFARYEAVDNPTLSRVRKAHLTATGLTYNFAGYGELAISNSMTVNQDTATETAVANSQLSAVTTGRPLLIKLLGKLIKSQQFSSGTTGGGYIYLYRDTLPDYSTETQLTFWSATHIMDAASTAWKIYFPGNLEYIDVDVQPGTRYYYRLKLASNGATSRISLDACRMYTYEL